MKYRKDDNLPAEIKGSSATFPPIKPKKTKTKTKHQNKNFFRGWNLVDLTASELDIKGNSTKTIIAANIEITPPNLSGQARKIA